jgi:hypothetical protein
MTHPIPAPALKDYVAIIGRVGSGKTYAAKGMVEVVLREQGRVVIIDPTGVWWGLRSSADGKRPGFPVVVFGGEHADVPLPEGAGAALARLLAGKNLPAIVDVSEFTIGQRTRFLTAFLDELYRANRTPLTLVVDEADIVAPQRPMPDQTVMFSRMEQICRRGRVRGFRPWLITQRPAELHKSVLSQANTLVAMQLTAPQDRDAVGAWIEGQADRDQGKKVLADLPKLKKGQGWAWSPSHDLLARLAFPAITTFDSGRTPEQGEALPQVELATVDLTGIAESLNAEAEKPPTRAAAVITAPDPEALAREYQRGHAEGFDDAMSAVRSFAAGAKMSLDDAQASFDRLVEAVRKESKPGAQAPRKSQPVSVRVESTFGVDAPAAAALTLTRTAAPVKRGTGAGVAMGKAERRILTAIAQRHPKPSTRPQISILSGYSHTSSHFANSIGALRSAGYVDGRGDEIQITDAGFKALGAFESLPTGRALIDYWAARLGKAERELFLEAVKRYPRAASKEALSEATGYSLTSSHFANSLGRLRTLQLVHGRGDIQANPDLFT